MDEGFPELPELTHVPVFLSSPEGLEPERAAVREVRSELNAQLRIFNVSIDLLSSDEHGPAAGRPQDDINPDVDRCQIFVGILWDRRGSPTGEADSGFEEEYRRVMERRVEGRWPYPLLWFKRVPQRQQDDPGPQLARVLAFRQELIEGKANYFREFDDEQEFRSQIRIRLWELVYELTRPNWPPPESLQGVGGGDRPPPQPPPAPPAEQLPLSINWGTALTTGPVHELPEGADRADKAEALEASRQRTRLDCG